ncbi:MAG: NAD(P)/FAD-dependent oxidoreductase [Chloroflexi bacterium]|nr:NAD(P)/FAD-dependent oxidoreductase [Chloroflexota bacterium]
MSYDADVLITGAGPGGCSAGIRLAEAGHDVLMLERDPLDAGPDITSGEVLALQTQIECEQLGVDLNADWAYERFRFVRNVYPDLSWTLHAIPEGMGHLAIDRGGFNAALRRRAVQAGARIVCEVTARDMELRADGAVVRTREGGEYRGRVLIDASGRHSVALNTLGLKEPEPEFQQIAVARFFESFEGTPPQAWDRHLYGDAGAMISGSQIRPGLFRYILEADLGVKQQGRMNPGEYYDYVARTYDPWIAERLEREPHVGGTWAMAPLAYRVAETVRDRLLLIGDAAGYLSPITGQGIEFAMRMGRLAAKTVGAALRAGDLTAGSFAEYVEARNAEVMTLAELVRMQLRLFRDRAALLRCAGDDEFRARVLLPLPVVERGSLLGRASVP